MQYEELSLKMGISRKPVDKASNKIGPETAPHATGFEQDSGTAVNDSMNSARTDTSINPNHISSKEQAPAKAIITETSVTPNRRSPITKHDSQQKEVPPRQYHGQRSDDEDQDQLSHDEWEDEVLQETKPSKTVHFDQPSPQDKGDDYTGKGNYSRPRSPERSKEHKSKSRRQPWLDPALGERTRVWEEEEDITRQKLQEERIIKAAELNKKNSATREHLKTTLVSAGYSEEIIKDTMKLDCERVMSLSQPIYVKAHRKHLSPETLDMYELPWEWDQVSLTR